MKLTTTNGKNYSVIQRDYIGEIEKITVVNAENGKTEQLLFNRTTDTVYTETSPNKYKPDSRGRLIKNES